MAQKELNLKSALTKPIHIEGDIWLVPCVANHRENDYRPLLKPLDTSLNSNEYTRKHLWTEKEDQTLKNLIFARGPRGWSIIAKEINSLVHNGLNIRQGRQCRERWFNHVDPDLNKGQWSSQEDEHLLYLQSQLGNKWSEISKELKGRNENAVKNRWKSIFKRKGIYSGLHLDNDPGEIQEFDMNTSSIGEFDLLDNASDVSGHFNELTKAELDGQEKFFDEGLDFSSQEIC
jgi:hypothetical protein